MPLFKDKLSGSAIKGRKGAEAIVLKHPFWTIKRLRYCVEAPGGTYTVQ